MPHSAAMLFRVLVVAAFSSTALADGSVVLDIGGDTNDSKEYKLIVGTDDRLYVSGCTVVALDRDGTLISTFGSGGLLTAGGGCDTHLLAGANGSYFTVTRGITAAQDSLTVGFEQHDATGVVRLSGAARQLGMLELPLVMVQQADGKVLLGGYTNTAIGVSEDWTLRRFNTDGTLDVSFSGGAFTEDLGSSSFEKVQGIQVLASGKVLVFGDGGAANDNDEAVLTRLNSDGTVDATYGAGGIVEFSSEGVGEVYRSNILAVDGTGRAYIQTGDEHTVVRVNANGTLDATYDGGLFDPQLNINAVVLDSSSRAVVFGARSPTNTATKGYIARFTSSGARDSSFGAGSGVIEVDLPTSQARVDARSLRCSGAVQQSGKPVLACTVPSPADEGDARLDVIVFRFNVDGTLDTTFGRNQPDSDIYPDAFSFAEKSAPFGTAGVISDRVTITGINSKTSIEMPNGDGGEYSIGCTDQFVSTPGTIDAGQSVCLRLRAPSSASGSARTTVRIGGRYGTFIVRSTTEAADTGSNPSVDTIPDSFSFAARIGVDAGSSVVSNAVRITGLSAAAAISISNGEYSVNCSSTGFVTQDSVINNGDSVCVRHTAASQAGASTSTTLTIGGVSSAFTSTTAMSSAAANPPAKSSGGGGALDISVLLLLAFMRAQRASSSLKSSQR